MAVNALKTFPSAVDGMPRGYFPTGSYGSGSAKMDMGRTDNAIHQSGMAWAKRYVNARSRIMSHNDRVMERGGYRNALPKPQPQGSLRMVYTNSGSNGYGGGRFAMSGGGGAFRTKSGSEYGRMKLRERGEQLMEQQIASEEGFPVGMEKPTEPVPLDKEETSKLAIEMAIREIYDASDRGDEEEMRGITNEMVKKLFNSLRLTGMVFTQEELNELFTYMGGVVDDFEGFRDAVKASLARVFYLIVALRKSYNLQETDRKKYIQQEARRLARMSGDDLVMDDALQEGVVGDLPANARRLTRGEIRDRLEEAEAFAPDVQLPRFGAEEMGGEAEREVARAMPPAMRPAGVAPAMPDDFPAAAPPADAEVPSGGLTRSQREFIRLASVRLEDIEERLGDEVIPIARRIVPQYVAQARGRSQAQLVRLVGMWEREIEEAMGVGDEELD